MKKIWEIIPNAYYEELCMLEVQFYSEHDNERQETNAAEK